MFPCQFWGINEQNEVLGLHFWEGKMGGNESPIPSWVKWGKIGLCGSFGGKTEGKGTHFGDRDEGKCVPFWE